MAPSLEEVVYDLARAALDEQREVVANLRSRAAPVLTGAGALAAFTDRDHPEIYLLRIAESHRQRRVANRDGVRALQRFLVVGLFGVVLEVVGFATALAVH